jgi:16S rRNA (guanine527-N7)-methyltransferase
LQKINKDSFFDKTNKLNIIKNSSFFNDINFYISALFEWNKIHNLTALKNSDEVYFNILDSLIPLSFDELSFNSVLDIGTGAGFPSLFYAIADKSLDITLVEPNKKRTAFLSFIKTNLKLQNLKVVTKKVENLESNKKYSLITSRAVTDTNSLLKISENRLDSTNKNSFYLFFKGSKLEKELMKTEDKSKKIIIKNSDLFENRKYLILS